MNVTFHVTTGFSGRDQVRHTRPPGHGRGNGRGKARLERRHERPARPSGLRHTGNVRAPPLATLPQGMYVCMFSREGLAKRLCGYFPRVRVMSTIRGRLTFTALFASHAPNLQVYSSTFLLNSQFQIFLKSELQHLPRPIPCLPTVPARAMTRSSFRSNLLFPFVCSCFFVSQPAPLAPPRESFS